MNRCGLCVRKDLMGTCDGGQTCRVGHFTSLGQLRGEGHLKITEDVVRYRAGGSMMDVHSTWMDERALNATEEARAGRSIKASGTGMSWESWTHWASMASGT